jgi:hypothetical protein
MVLQHHKGRRVGTRTASRSQVRVNNGHTVMGMGLQGYGRKTEGNRQGDGKSLELHGYILVQDQKKA